MRVDNVFIEDHIDFSCRQGVFKCKGNQLLLFDSVARRDFGNYRYAKPVHHRVDNTVRAIHARAGFYFIKMDTVFQKKLFILDARPGAEFPGYKMVCIQKLLQRILFACEI